jgi:hypothetical protein
VQRNGGKNFYPGKTFKKYVRAKILGHRVARLFSNQKSQFE